MDKDLELIKSARDIIQTHTNYEYVKFQYDEQHNIIGFTLTNKKPRLKKIETDIINRHRLAFELLYDDDDFLEDLKRSIRYTDHLIKNGIIITR